MKVFIVCLATLLAASTAHAGVDCETDADCGSGKSCWHTFSSYKCKLGGKKKTCTKSEAMCVKDAFFAGVDCNDQDGAKVCSSSKTDSEHPGYELIMGGTGRCTTDEACVELATQLGLKAPDEFACRKNPPSGDRYWDKKKYGAGAPYCFRDKNQQRADAGSTGDSPADYAAFFKTASMGAPQEWNPVERDTQTITWTQLYQEAATAGTYTVNPKLRGRTAKAVAIDMREMAYKEAKNVDKILAMQGGSMDLAGVETWKYFCENPSKIASIKGFTRKDKRILSFYGSVFRDDAWNVPYITIDGSKARCAIGPLASDTDPAGHFAVLLER